MSGLSPGAWGLLGGGVVGGSIRICCVSNSAVLGLIPADISTRFHAIRTVNEGRVGAPGVWRFRVIIRTTCHTKG